jgi:hypothetical protein
MTLKLTKCRAESNLFLRTEHPGVQIPKPENRMGLMGADVFDGDSELVEGKTGHIDRPRRLGSPDRGCNEHWTRIVDRL